jgi:hypothetical protein
MPWRLVGFVIVFGIFLAFIAFNLENSCDISFGLHTFSGVPVYLTALTAFILGLFWSIPLAVSFRLKKRAKQAKGEDSGPEAPKAKTKGGKKQAGDIPELSSPEPGGPYGIN